MIPLIISRAVEHHLANRRRFLDARPRFLTGHGIGVLDKG